MGMEQELAEGYVKRISHILPGELIILKSNELAEDRTFWRLMRDILIYVYQNNIEEILIVDPNRPCRPRSRRRPRTPRRRCRSSRSTSAASRAATRSRAGPTPPFRRSFRD